MDYALARRDTRRTPRIHAAAVLGRGRSHDTGWPADRRPQQTRGCCAQQTRGCCAQGWLH